MNPAFDKIKCDLCKRVENGHYMPSLDKNICVDCYMAEKEKEKDIRWQAAAAAGDSVEEKTRFMAFPLPSRPSVPTSVSETFRQEEQQWAHIAGSNPPPLSSFSNRPFINQGFHPPTSNQGPFGKFY